MKFASMNFFAFFVLFAATHCLGFVLFAANL